ncbi:hypothetical protein FRC03_009456 [Tulasnella sp. 419]|nr:hypothetical protein FRC03_009456 [Tulasnella sp. 419]
MTSLCPDDEISLQEETGDLHCFSPNPENMAASIELAAKDVHFCHLSALYIAEQAVRRVIAFRVWSTVGEKERRLDACQTYGSLKEEARAYQRLLAFRLEQSRRLETLHSHLKSIKRLLEQFKNVELIHLVSFDDILATMIMAWIVITCAEELETAIVVAQRTKSSDAFTRALEHDAYELQSKKEQQHNISDQESNFDKNCFLNFTGQCTSRMMSKYWT